MSLPRLFLIFAAALLLCIIAIQRPLPRVDLFNVKSEEKKTLRASLYFSEIYAAKLAHANAQPRYQLGLFGNSRTVSLSKLEVEGFNLGNASERYFNFSILGASPRANILLIEELNAISKLPKRVLFSFDHFELEQFFNPSINNIAVRLALAAREVKAGITKDYIGIKELAKAGWRQIYVAGQDLSLLFNFVRLTNGLAWWTRQLLRGNAWSEFVNVRGQLGWQADGSYGQRRHNRATQKFTLMQPEPATILPGYLQWDMERLAAITATGVDIIVYESLLDPLNGAHYKKSPSARVSVMRQRWLSACKRLQLTCIPFEPSWLISSDYGWSDATHPPPDVLASYLKKVISAAKNISSETRLAR